MYVTQAEMVLSDTIGYLWNVWLFGVGGIMTIMGVLMGIMYCIHLLRKWIGRGR